MFTAEDSFYQDNEKYCVSVIDMLTPDVPVFTCGLNDFVKEYPTKKPITLTGAQIKMLMTCSIPETRTEVVDGIPVYLSSGEAALEVRTTGDTITYFRLQYRQYTAAEESYHLLPLAQAVHMAGGYEETVFLTKGYVDRGGETVAAQWLAR